MGAHKDTGWEWDFKWKRHLFDSELTMAASFLNDVVGSQIQPNRRDDWAWKPDPRSQYSAKRAYDVLRGDLTQGNDDAVFEELWKLRIPIKVSVFAWRLLRHRLPTKVNSRRWQVKINDSRCPFRRSIEEDAAHLFLHCSKILPIWWESMSWVNILSAFLQNPRQHFSQHVTAVADGIRANRWRCWWLAFTWSIWLLRNKIIFSNDTFNGNKLMEDAIFLLWTWLRNFEKDFVIHYNHWSSNLRDAFVY